MASSSQSVANNVLRESNAVNRARSSNGLQQKLLTEPCAPPGVAVQTEEAFLISLHRDLGIELRAKTNEEPFLYGQ